MKKILTAAAALAAVPMLLAGAGVAAAAPTSNCGSSACFYYDSNEQGSSWGGGSGGVADFAPYSFPQDGLDGHGQHVKNNVASVTNTTGWWLCVFYNENFGGPFDSIAPYGSANLLYVPNNNASYRFQFSHC